MAAKIPDNVLTDTMNIIARDKNRNKKFDAMDMMFHNRLEKPPELKDKRWFRMAPTTAPSDAVWGATRTLSSIEPDITYAPISLHPDDKDKADKIERVLKTLYRKAERRSKSKHTRQIVWNAVLYDMVAVQLEFIPFMLTNPNNSKKLNTRLEKSLRFGPFIINVRNAKNVHAVHSELGLESVVYEQVMPAREAINYWGNAKLKREVKDAEWVYIIDFTTEEMRYVSASVLTGDTVDLENLKDPISLVNAKHGLDFLPWVIKGGGSTTETDPEKHHRPLLDSVYHSNQAHTVSLLMSLLVSDSIYNYFNPNTATVTHTGEAPDLEADSPRGNIDLKIGESIFALPPNQLDTGMLTLLQTLLDDMQRSTAPRILFGEVPSDISFATYNAGVQAASRTIIPHKEVAEDALVEIFTQMLMWSQHANENLTALISFENASGELERDPYTIKFEEIDINDVDMKVELKADIPIDRQARMNTAVQGYTNLPLPARPLLEYVGFADADQLIKQREQEDIDRVAMQNVGSGLSREFRDALKQEIRQEVLAEVQQEMENAQSGSNGADGAPTSP